MTTAHPLWSAPAPGFRALVDRAGLVPLTVRRRLSTNYRIPGLGRQASLRVSRLLRDPPGRDGAVELRLATEVDAEIDGAVAGLDLTAKAARLLAENAALVSAESQGASDIANLGWSGP